MTVVKKDLTANNIVSPGDGVYAEQLNYGASTGSLRSVSDVIIRHFEDYNAKFIPNRIYGNSALTQSGLQFTLGGGASVYATVNGRWIKISADESHTVSTTDGTYVVYLTVTNASSDEENRNPSNDAVSLTSIAIGSYTDTNDKLPLAVVEVSSGAYSSHTDLYGVAGSTQLRASGIRPANGSSINFFGGTYPQDSLVGLFNATRLRLEDDIYLALGTDNDGLLRYSTANSQLEFTLPSNGLEISGGTITGVPDPTANDEVANKAYVDAQITLEDVDIATDSGSIDIDLDSETLTLTGTGALSTSATGTTVTFDVPVDDTAVDGSTTKPISSNWAYDHNADSRHHVKYALTEDLASGEITQLKNINSSTISTTQWGYLGGLNQALTTSSSVTFNSISASSTQLVSANPDSAGTHGNSGDIGDVNLAYSDDSQEYTYTDAGTNPAYTVISGQANTITVLKDSISVYHSISVQLLNGQTVRTANVDVVLEANNGSGWTPVDSHSYSGLTGNSSTTLTWTIPSGSKYYSDDFGDSIQLRAGVRFTPNASATSGLGVLSSFNITNGTDWARFPRILSANAGSTLNSFV